MILSMRIVPWRSLRLRLIVLLVLSVVCVLAAATALEIRLSTRLAERNLQERALTLGKEIDILLGSLWGRTDLRNFHHRLAELARTHRNVADIEILLPVRDQWRLLEAPGERPPRSLSLWIGWRWSSTNPFGNCSPEARTLGSPWPPSISANG